MNQVVLRVLFALNYDSKCIFQGHQDNNAELRESHMLIFLLRYDSDTKSIEATF